MPYSIRSADKNQAGIVAELRAAGYSVLDMHTLGHGAPDILVGYGGVSIPFEIKRPGFVHLSPAEKDFHAAWRGSIYIATCVDDIIHRFNTPIKPKDNDDD